MALVGTATIARVCAVVASVASLRAASLATAAAPGEDTRVARARIDALCAARDERSRGSDPVVVARVYGAGETGGRWRVADAALLARVARDPDLYSDVARVYRADGSVAIARVRTRSLDYHADAEYCYRASGTLARERDTSSGTVNRDDEARYLDQAGRVVARSSTLSPLSPTPGASVSPDLRPARPDLYTTVRALPFFELIEATNARGGAAK